MLVSIQYLAVGAEHLFRRHLLFRCGDIKNVLKNKFIQSIHLKPFQSAFIRK
jgi:hypothetical protein